MVFDPRKRDRKRPNIGLPSNSEGRNGDIELFLTPKGLILYGKFNDEWYPFSEAEKKGAFNTSVKSSLEITDSLTLKNQSELKLFNSSNKYFSSFKNSDAATQSIEYTLPPTGYSSAGMYLAVGASNRLQWKPVADVLTDLGITSAEILDWTSDQGSSNIHASNFVDLNPSGTLNISSGTLTTSAAQNKAIVEGVAANTDIGAYEFRAQTFQSDATTVSGSAPFTVASTVKVANLNADMVDGATLVDEDNMASNSATKIPTQQSVKAYVDTEISGLVDSAPGALDTLNELAAALNDDASFSTTVTNSIATKLPLAGGTMTGDLIIAADNKIKSDTTGTNNFIEFDNDDGSPENQTLISSVTNVALIVDGNGNGTGQFEVLKAGTDSTATELFRIENDGDAVFTGDLYIPGEKKIQFDSADTSIYTNSDNPEDLYIESDEDMYLRPDDNLVIACGTTNYVTFDGTNERVGIGTSTPDADLHLHSASGTANLWITGPGSNPSSAGNLRFAEQEDGNNFFQFSHDGNANTLSVDSNNQSDMTVWDRSNNRVTHAASTRFYRAWPQVRFSDDSGTDYVDAGLTSNTFLTKSSDANIDFQWHNSSAESILHLDSSARTVTIGEGAQSTYNLKIGNNGRMNMPQRGLEFENAHGYFSPLGDMFMPLFINGSQTDLIRFQTPITFEYWDYSSSAWVDDSSNVGDLQKLLDGRRSTSHSLTNTKRKFRFVIERESTWADDHLFYIENTWSSIGTWTTSASGGGSLTPTMVVERLDGSFDASDDTNNDWTTNSGITTNWHTTGIWNGFGLAMYYSTGMHNAEKHIRVTVTFPEYADTSKTIGLKNIGIISSYSSANSNRNALVQDFNRNMTGYGILNLTSGHEYRIDNTSVLSATTLGSGVVNSSLTSVGTISSGTWQGTAIASAYLDSDTAHLSGTQTFSGNKTFTGTTTIADARITMKDTRSTYDAPDIFNKEVRFEFKQSSSIGGPSVSNATYGGLMTIAPWGDSSGDATHQLFFHADASSTTNGGIFWRTGDPGDSATSDWGDFKQIFTALDTIPAGNIATLNQDTTGTAAIATTVTITDNESTDENNAIIFAAGADTDGGNLGLESDGNFTYNPSDATINAGKLNLSGSGINITNDSATELNFNGTNNTNITSAGNMYIKAASTKKLYFGAGGTDSLVTLDTNGFVGIGNTGPNHLLHVGDDVTASFGTTPDKAIQLSSSTNDHEIAYILYAGEGTNNIRSKYYVDDDTKYVGWDSTHSTGWLGYEWKIAGSQSMTLDTSGNLGVSGAVNLGHASDTTLARVSSGKISVEGSNVLMASGGADLATALNTDLGGDFVIGTQSDDTATFNGSLMLRKEGGIFVENLGSPTGTSTGFGGSILIPPKGMYRTSTNAVTGAIKIHIPRGTGDATDWISMWVDVTDYATDESFSAYIQGYMYKNEPGSESTATEDHEWVSETAMIFAKKQDRDFTVSYGHDDTDWFVAIGAVDSTWSYPQITVRDVQIGGGSDIDDYTDDWDITFVTDFGTTVHQTHTDNFPVTSNLAVTDEDSDSTCFPLFVDTATGTLAPHTNAEFTFDASNSRLGIGTDPTPNYKVHAKGTGWGGQGIGIESSTTSGAVLTLKTTQRAFEVSSRSNGFNIRDLTDSDTSRFNISSSGTASFEDNDITNVGDIALDSISSDAGTSINVTLGTDAGDDFIVDTDTLVVEGDNNRVGIGTTSPSVKLHVDSSTSDTVAIFKSSDSTARIQIQDDDTTNHIVSNNSTLSLGANNTTHAGNLNIDSNGKIGIGLTAPTTTLDVEGTVSYKHTVFSTAGPTDSIDVSDTTVLEVDTSSNNVTIGGFSGGVQGQVLYIVKTDTTNFIQLEHNESPAAGSHQKIYLTSGADERVVGYGGYTLYCNGTNWYSLSNPTGAADAG